MYLSASVRIPTFWRILWQRVRTSNSLQISFTSSNINSVSSDGENNVQKLLSSCLFLSSAATEERQQISRVDYQNKCSIFNSVLVLQFLNISQPKLWRSVLDFFLICPVSSLLLLLLWVRNVGVPSTVVTHGLVSPPFSNSWAEILRMGVAPPDPVDLEPVDRDLQWRRVWRRLNVTSG